MYLLIVVYKNVMNFKKFKKILFKRFLKDYKNYCAKASLALAF